MTDLRKEGVQGLLTDASVGPLTKYRRLVAGDSGFWSFLKYEFITSVFGPWPGALGLWLRQKFYPCLFRECGRKVIFGRDLTLRHPHRMTLGNRIVIGDRVILDGKGTQGEGLLIRDGVYIGAGTVVTTTDGTIILDEACNIGGNCRIGSFGRTRIGKKALLAAFCYVVGAGHETSRLDIPILDQPNTTRGGSEVGDGCWFGARVTVMDGVKVGAHSIVGAHAVVTKDLPEFCVAVGIPAQVVRMRK